VPVVAPLGVADRDADAFRGLFAAGLDAGLAADLDAGLARDFPSAFSAGAASFFADLAELFLTVFLAAVVLAVPSPAGAEPAFFDTALFLALPPLVPLVGALSAAAASAVGWAVAASPSPPLFFPPLFFLAGRELRPVAGSES